VSEVTRRVWWQRLAAAFRGWLLVPRVVRFSLPIAIMTVLWWSSEQPPSHREPDLLRALAHNAMHVVAFGSLAAALHLAMLRSGGPLELTRWRVVSLAVTVAYGIVDEVHQYFVPGRAASFLDVLSDTSGGVLALVALGAVRPGGLRRVAAWAGVSVGCVAAATFLPW
jgi:VanZ family protein